MDKVPAKESKRARLENGGDDDPSVEEQVEVPVPAAVAESSLPEETSDCGASADDDDPDAPGAALSSLPEEILEKIFSHLDSAEDLHAVSNASDQFNRILAPDKPVWGFESVFPIIFAYLDFDDTVNCRLVCKKWCRAVDKDLQSRPSTRPFSVYPDEPSDDQKERGNPPLYAPRFETYLVSKGMMDHMFYTSGDISNFLEDMRDHPRNPLLFRSVYFHNKWASEDFWEWVQAFVARFGSEIWHTSIASWDEGDDPENRPFVACGYELVVQLLSQMPNIKTLGLCGYFEDRPNRPLPALPHLQKLELLVDEDEVDRNVNTFVDVLLIAYIGQVKLISWCSLSLWRKHRRLFTDLPQIKEITLIVDEKIGIWRRFCQRLVAPHLSKLNLVVKQNWSVSKFLQPLAINLPSLKYLSLQFRAKPKDFKILIPPKFVLENVKTLEIVDNHMAEYNHLFQHLPALEYLVVCHEKVCGHNEPFVGPFNQPHLWKLFEWIQGTSVENSDIWTRLGHLKQLTLARMGDNDNNGDIENEIRVKISFTREMYTGFGKIEK